MKGAFLIFGTFSEFLKIRLCILFRYQIVKSILTSRKLLHNTSFLYYDNHKKVELLIFKYILLAFFRHSYI